MSRTITVHKLDDGGREVWRYQGQLLARGPHWLRLEATFDRERTESGRLTIEPGDRFIETFYDDRWYNVFAIHDPHGRVFRGWYCNIARPATLEAADVYQEDLALDLIVLPDGSTEILDQREFDALALPVAERRQAEQALQDLLDQVRRAEPPFQALADQP